MNSVEKCCLSYVLYINDLKRIFESEESGGNRKMENAAQ
jgi:hypothetical protein